MYANMSHPAIVAGDFEKEEAATAAATTETPRLHVFIQQEFRSSPVNI